MADQGYGYDEEILQQAVALLTELGKRQRAVFEIPNTSHVPSHYPYDNETCDAVVRDMPSHASGHAVVRDTESINILYERYLRSLPNSHGTEAGRSTEGFDELVEINDLSVLGLGCSKPDAQGQSSGVCGVPETALPADASATLFVEGLPASCTRREVSHIFRPFHGYKEVRVVMKETKRPGGDPLVLCFVDFETPAHAATAMDALQGYVFDEHDRDSWHLRLQFSHTPGARTGHKNLGRQWD